MIEKDLERAVMARVGAAVPETVQVSGVWQPSAMGVVKGEEKAGAMAYATVAVAPRSHETFATPKADFAVAVALVVRQELCPDGAALADFTEHILAVLEGWQMSVSAMQADLSVPGFAPCGLRLDGGNVKFSDAARAWTVTQSFTVRGVVTTKGRTR